MPSLKMFALNFVSQKKSRQVVAASYLVDFILDHTQHEHEQHGILLVLLLSFVIQSTWLQLSLPHPQFFLTSMKSYRSFLSSFVIQSTFLLVALMPGACHLHITCSSLCSLCNKRFVHFSFPSIRSTLLS